MFALHVSLEFLNGAHNITFHQRFFFQDNMKLWLLFLFLQLWENLGVSSQNVCFKLPDIPHAHVSEETKKASYQDGDEIHFKCNPGYTSDQSSKYICTSLGWQVVQQGNCFSCSNLPDVPHAYVPWYRRKAEYQIGDMLDFSCEAGYTSDVVITYVCLSDGWLPVRQGSCYIPASSCSNPPASEGLTIKGFPENESPIPPHHILTFSCDDPGKHLDGSSVLICGKDGQWNNPVPSCREVRCSDPTDPNVGYWGATWAQKKLRSKVQYSCINGFDKPQGVTKAECTRDGWIPNPLCEGTKCDKPHVENAGIRPERNSYINQDKVRIDCLYGDKTFEMTCQRGAWTGMQSCPGSDCSSPPLLDNGDIKHSLKQEYKHDEKVEYLCQAWHIMEGGPFRKCVDGEWTGEITCLKPCTVNEDDMTANNIQLIRGEGKIYLTHGDHITFECTGRKSRVGSVAFRPMCKDGVITLPRCE